MEILREQNPPAKSRKRDRHPEKWKTNVTKTNKALGLPYTAYHSRKIMPGRESRDISCRHHCTDRITAPEKIEIFSRFNLLKDHEKQNIYLQGCMGGTGQRNCKISCIGRVVYVCRTYFLALHGLTYSRIRRKVLKPQLPIQDGRGKHGHHKKTSEEILNIVRTYLQNLPSRESHYSTATNPHRKYLGANTTIKKLYEDLINSENNVLNRNSLKIWQFRKIYNYEFNIGIGFPRSDICETCESFYCNIKHAQLNGDLARVENLQDSQRVHHEEANQFYRRMSKTAENFNDPSFGFYCFDFEKNLQFPVTNIGKEFFLRQLWLFNFTIHNLKTGDAYMFMYCENFAKKGSNETISFLKYFIERIISPEVQNLRLFFDNSGGQNKNRFMFAYLQTLCLQRFASVKITLPLPGHSRMQVDADFALIEKKKRKEDRIHFPSDWIRIVRNARSSKPFYVYYGNRPVTDNLQDDGTPVVEVFDFKSILMPLIGPSQGITRLRQILFQRGTFHPLASTSLMQEPLEQYQIMRPNVTPQFLLDVFSNARPAYDGYIPISKEKYDNISFLLTKFHRLPEKTFYSSVFAARVEETPQQRIIRMVMNEYPEPIDLSFLD